MKEQFGSYAARFAAKIHDAGADFDPEVLQLPGGSFIAAALWIYANGRRALHHGRQCRESALQTDATGAPVVFVSDRR